MSEKVVVLKNEYGEVRSVDVGFSWWTAFFGWIAPAIAGSPSCAIALIVADIILFFVAQAAVSSAVSKDFWYYAFNPDAILSIYFWFFVGGKVVDCIVASQVGMSVVNRLIDRGFRPIDERNQNILSSSGIELDVAEGGNTSDSQKNSSNARTGTLTINDLNSGPKDAYAYISKLTVDLELAGEADLATLDRPLKDFKDFQKALFFASEDYKKVLEGYAKSVDDNIALKNKEVKYREAGYAKNAAEYQKAYEMYKQLDSYKDSEQLTDECTRLLKAEELAAEEAEAVKKKEDLENSKKTRTYLIIAVVAIVVVTLFIMFPKTSLTPQNTSAQKPNTPSAQSVQAGAGTITADYVRIRSTPDASKDDNVIHRAFKGDSVKVLGYKDVSGARWHEVNFIEANKKGWVRSDYLKLEK